MSCRRVERHLAFERTAERGGDPALQMHSGPRGDLGHRAELLDRLRDRHVHVGQVVALARRQHGVDGVHAGVDRAGRALVVGHQRRVARAGAPPDAGHDRLGVAQLGDGLGVHERGDLDAGHAGLGEAIDHVDLLLGRDEVRLDLKAVPGAHLANRDALRQSHARLPRGLRVA